MHDQPRSLILLCQSRENPRDLRLSPQGKLTWLIKSQTEAQADLAGLLKTLNASAARSTPLQVFVSFVRNLCATLPPLRSMLMDYTANKAVHFATMVSTGQEAVRGPFLNHPPLLNTAKCFIFWHVFLLVRNTICFVHATETC